MGRFDLGAISEHRRTAEPMQANFPELSEMAHVIAAEFGVEVSSRVAVLDESFAVVIGRVDGPEIIHFESNLARQELPHCSALGKVLLSHLSEQQVRATVDRTGLPARTAATITDVESLLRELEGRGRVGLRSTTKRTARECSAWPRRSSTVAALVWQRSV